MFASEAQTTLVPPESVRITHVSAFFLSPRLVLQRYRFLLIGLNSLHTLPEPRPLSSKDRRTRGQTLLPTSAPPSKTEGSFRSYWGTIILEH